jgi:hypothetical protein
MGSLLNSGFLDLVINMQTELCFSMLKLHKCYILIHFVTFFVRSSSITGNIFEPYILI